MKTKNLVRAISVSVTLVSLPWLAAQTPAPLPAEVVRYADTVLYNGAILTADDRFTIAEGVAIRDGKILAVGTSQRVLSLAGPETKKIDLEGKSLVPGFFDTHLHGAWVGNIAKRGRGGRVNFEDKDRAFAEIKKMVEGASPGEWIVLSGPRTKNFYSVTRRDLDPISPQNPLVFITQSQEVLANSVALKLANLPPEMPGVLKDAKTGEPTGQLFSFAAGVVTYDVMPLPQVTEEMLANQKTVLRRLNSQGLTTIIGRGQGLTTSILKELWQRQELTARVRITHEFTRLNPQLESYLKRMGNLSGFGDAWMKIVGATVQPVDGTTGDAAALSAKRKIRRRPEDPYEWGANKWLAYGPIQQEDPKERTEWNSILLANRYGWNVTSVHSQGDLGTQILLEAYAEADKEKSLQGRRFGFDHGLMRTPENFKLAKQLDVIPSIGPKYMFMGSPSTLIFLYGADAVHEMTPVKSLIQMGIKPVLEADIAGAYSAPLWLMEKLITRMDEKGTVWGPQEKISRQEALWMKTNWAARYSGDERISGTIEAGKLADLVVLDGDYMKVPEQEISKIPILLTYVDGRVVYDRQRDGDVRTPLWDRPGAFGVE
ncbi:MAG: amidohydrolase family protein [Acidobacteria bacterium]|nr:amidohydrolase family protein [Acidobacteriota bacterium]